MFPIQFAISGYPPFLNRPKSYSVRSIPYQIPLNSIKSHKNPYFPIVVFFQVLCAAGCDRGWQGGPRVRETQHLRVGQRVVRVVGWGRCGDARLHMAKVWLPTNIHQLGQLGYFQPTGISNYPRIYMI